MREVLLFSMAIVLIFCAISDCRRGSVYAEPLILVSVLGASARIVMGLDLFDGLMGMGLGLCFMVLSWLLREQIGYGDGLVLVSTGALCGTNILLMTLFAAFMGLALFSAGGLITGKVHAKDRIPAIPFIAMGYFGVLIYEMF